MTINTKSWCQILLQLSCQHLYVSIHPTLGTICQKMSPTMCTGWLAYTVGKRLTMSLLVFALGAGMVWSLHTCSPFRIWLTTVLLYLSKVTVYSPILTHMFARAHTFAHTHIPQPRAALSKQQWPAAARIKCCVSLSPNNLLARTNSSKGGYWGRIKESLVKKSLGKLETQKV